MLVRKLTEWTGIRIAMVPRALTASSGLARGAWLWIVLRQRKRKIQPLKGVKGACPLILPPPLGERGVTLAISTPALENSKGFPMKITIG